MRTLGEPCIACTIKHLLAAYAITTTVQYRNLVKCPHIGSRPISDVRSIREDFNDRSGWMPTGFARVAILIHEARGMSQWRQNLDLASGLLAAMSHRFHATDRALRLADLAEEMRKLISQAEDPSRVTGFWVNVMTEYFPETDKNLASYMLAHLVEALRECPRGFQSTDRIDSVTLDGIPQYVAELRKEFEIPVGKTIVNQEDPDGHKG